MPALALPTSAFWPVMRRHLRWGAWHNGALRRAVAAWGDRRELPETTRTLVARWLSWGADPQQVLNTRTGRRSLLDLSLGNPALAAMLLSAGAQPGPGTVRAMAARAARGEPLGPDPWIHDLVRLGARSNWQIEVATHQPAPWQRAPAILLIDHQAPGAYEAWVSARRLLGLSTAWPEPDHAEEATRLLCDALLLRPRLRPKAPDRESASRQRMRLVGQGADIQARLPADPEDRREVVVPLISACWRAGDAALMGVLIARGARIDRDTMLSIGEISYPQAMFNFEPHFEAGQRDCLLIMARQPWAPWQTSFSLTLMFNGKNTGSSTWRLTVPIILDRVEPGLFATMEAIAEQARLEQHTAQAAGRQRCVSRL